MVWGAFIIIKWSVWLAGNDAVLIQQVNNVDVLL
jgi:hypothetical protein